MGSRKIAKYMKNRKLGWILILGLALIPTVARADTSLLIEFPDQFFGFFWSDDSIWDNGSPTTDCDAISEQFDFFTGETLDVDVQVDVPTTIENFTMDTPFVDLLVESNFSVTGTTTIESGSVVVFGKTAALGTLVDYDSATNTLGSGGGYIVRENPTRVCFSRVGDCAVARLVVEIIASGGHASSRSKL